MSTLGKVLAVLNVLAAAGFVALAAMDYSQRYSYSYATWRHDLNERGLPLDANETAAVSGDNLKNELDEQTRAKIKRVMQTLDGQPLDTQVEEAANDQKRLQTKIDGDDP